VPSHHRCRNASSATHVKIIRDEKPEDCVGDMLPLGESEASVGRRGGVAVDLAARAAADDAAASSFSWSFCCCKKSEAGEGRRPGTAGDWPPPRDMESTTESSSSCFCWMLLNWLITSSRLAPEATPLEAIGAEEIGYDSLHNSCGV
jgi:hypothetical protein